MKLTFKNISIIIGSILILTSLFVSSIALQAQEEAGPQQSEVETAEDEGGEEVATQEASQNIVELASGTENLSTLVAALTAADLVSTLEGPGPFTILAPQDSAFEALPDGLVDALLLPENKNDLIKVLTLHAIPAELDSAAVTEAVGTDVETVQGATVAISQDGSDLVINESARVVTADVAASNGIVHIIDNVLVPEDLDVTGILASAELARTGGRDSQLTMLWSNTTLVSSLSLLIIAVGVSSIVVNNRR